MRPLTLLRATSLVAVAVTGWSINVRWGADLSLGDGAPGQWERHVVGAILLAIVACAALVVSGRKGALPSYLARAIALAAGLGVVAIALYLRHDASTRGFPELIAGPGWRWLLVGGGLASASAATAFALPQAARKKAARRR